MRTENQDEKIKYILYARKSSESEDRQVASIEAQVEELKKLAAKNHLEIVDTLSESMSAKDPDERPVFNQMVERMKKGKANGILCWKLNRLARNPIDGSKIDWMLQQGEIRHIQTFGRSYYPTDNVIVMAVELGMANQFVRELSVDTKRGLRAKAERGWYPTFATLGYKHNPNKKKGEKEITIDPERFKLVKKMFELMLTGNYRAPQVLKIAAEQWGLRNRFGKKISRSTIYRIFNDTFYYGWFEYPKESGNWYEGKHTAMISKTQFDKIQILLGRKGRPKPKKYQFAFRGPIVCGECGAAVTADRKELVTCPNCKRRFSVKHRHDCPSCGTSVAKIKNLKVYTYEYYFCTKKKDPNCSQRAVTNEELEKQIIGILDRIEIPIEFHQWAMKWLKKENEKEFEDRNLILANQQNAYQKCLKKIDRLIDLRADGEISEEEFSRKKAETSKEKMRLHELLNDTDNRVDGWLGRAEECFNFARDAKHRFENGGLETRKTILNNLGSKLLLKDKNLCISLEKPLSLMEKVSETLRATNTGFETANLGLNKAKNRALDPVFVPMLWGRDSNAQPND